MKRKLCGMFLFACEKCAMRERNGPNELCAKRVEAGSEPRRATVWVVALLSRKRMRRLRGDTTCAKTSETREEFSMSRVVLYGKNYSK